MRKINIKGTIFRTLLIWFISLFLASLFYTIYFYFNQSVSGRDSFVFLEKLWTLIIVTAMFDFPALFILFFGLHYVYKKTNTIRSRYLGLLFLGILYSFVVLISMKEMKSEALLILGSGHSFISIITTIVIPYLIGDLKPDKYIK